MPAAWDDIIPEEEQRIMEAAGFGARQEMGDRPALLVIDVNYAFVGRKPLPIMEAIARDRTSCGLTAWAAVPAIGRVLEAARAASLPVIYTTGRSVGAAAELGRWATKNRRATEDMISPSRLEIVKEVAPVSGDVIIEKAKPSAFFGTDLLSHLIDAGIDTLLIVGGTTSGCVRATVLDAFSYNFRVAVVEDATFDRSQVSHAVSLFDMNAKYANVMSVDEALEYVSGRSKAPHAVSERAIR